MKKKNFWKHQTLIYVEFWHTQLSKERNKNAHIHLSVNKASDRVLGDYGTDTLLYEK